MQQRAATSAAVAFDVNSCTTTIWLRGNPTPDPKFFVDFAAMCCKYLSELKNLYPLIHGLRYANTA
jgi:hypothetical protein